VVKGHEDNTLSDATRVGSLALFLHATVSLFTGFIVPLIVQQTTVQTISTKALASFGIVEKTLGFHRFTLWNVWLISHVFFGICLLSISFVHSLTIAILIVGFMGINRAITAWAPHALLAAELSCTDEKGNLASFSNARAGVILGVHNMAISLPQIISALSSSGIFWLVRTCQGDSANCGLEWIFRLSTLPAFVAAFLTMRLDGNRAESGNIALRSFKPKGSALSLS
jgi:solute carrier family 45, member 1/2/4